MYQLFFKVDWEKMEFNVFLKALDFQDHCIENNYIVRSKLMILSSLIQVSYLLSLYVPSLLTMKE